MSDIPSWVRPGAQCVCVDDRWQDLSHLFGGRSPDRVPMINEVLTIRDVVGRDELKKAWEGRFTIPHQWDGALLSFNELGHDWLFSYTHFRPLISQADDLEAHFSKLLDAPLNHEREEA